jgi:hypothetical protein
MATARRRANVLAFFFWPSKKDANTGPTGAHSAHESTAIYFAEFLRRPDVAFGLTAVRPHRVSILRTRTYHLPPHHLPPGRHPSRCSKGGGISKNSPRIIADGDNPNI